LVHPDESTSYPDDRRYTPEHEWARVEGHTVRVGITAHAQEALGGIVFVQLPEIGMDVEAGQPFGEVESPKMVSDVFAPVAGRVVARNETLENTPELVNSDPYGDGWLVELEVPDVAALDALLDDAAYKKLVEEH
jgi:glycine cleavage system H protein